MDCIFCKIAKNEIASDAVYEDGVLRVVKDIHPKAPVHLLVIPKIHIQSVDQLEEIHNDLIAQLIHAAKNTARSQGLSGYKLVFNVGRGGGQVIDHLHLHILGGWKNDQEKTLNV